MTGYAQLEPPAAVASAIKLIYISLGLGVVRILLEWPEISAGTSAGTALLLVVITFAVLFWLASRVARGRNWARIVLLVFFLVGLPFSIKPLLQSLGYAPLSGMLGIVQLLLQGVSLAQLFSAQAGPWFSGADAGVGGSPDLKKCPYCAEWIRREAIKCRYCGSAVSAR